jgi:hypothetical protein
MESKIVEVLGLKSEVQRKEKSPQQVEKTNDI